MKEHFCLQLLTAQNFLNCYREIGGYLEVCSYTFFTEICSSEVRTFHQEGKYVLQDTKEILLKGC